MILYYRMFKPVEKQRGLMPYRAFRKTMSLKRFSDYTPQPNDLYELPERSVLGAAYSNSFDFKKFKFMLIGLERQFKFNLSSSTIVRSATLGILLYYCMYVIHRTTFVRYLAKNSIVVSAPEFVFNILYKLSSETRSRNRITGWTKGEMNNTDTDKTMIAVLQSLVSNNCQGEKVYPNLEPLKTLLQGTLFSKVAHDARLLNALFSELKLRLSVFEHEYTEDDVFNFVLGVLEDLPSMFSHYGPPAFADRVIDDYTSMHIGIYRFRDYDHGVYITAQAGISNINSQTLNLFACYLNIFEPTFQFEDGTFRGLLGGETLFDVSKFPLEDAWERLFSYSIVSGSPRGDNSVKKRKVGNVGNNDTEQEATLGNEYRNSGDQTATNFHMDGYKDYTRYISPDGRVILFESSLTRSERVEFTTLSTYRSEERINYG